MAEAGLSRVNPGRLLTKSGLSSGRRAPARPIVAASLRTHPLGRPALPTSVASTAPCCVGVERSLESGGAARAFAWPLAGHRVPAGPDARHGAADGSCRWRRYASPTPRLRRLPTYAHGTRRYADTTIRGCERHDVPEACSSDRWTRRGCPAAHVKCWQHAHGSCSWIHAAWRQRCWRTSGKEGEDRWRKGCGRGGCGREGEHRGAERRAGFCGRQS